MNQKQQTLNLKKKSNKLIDKVLDNLELYHYYKKGESMAKEEKLRSEIDDKYKWDLTPIYKNEDDWKKDYEEVKNEIEKVKNFKNTFLKNGQELYKFLEYDEKVSRKLEKLYYYAHLNYDSNTLEEK